MRKEQERPSKTTRARAVCSLSDQEECGRKRANVNLPLVPSFYLTLVSPFLHLLSHLSAAPFQSLEKWSEKRKKKEEEKTLFAPCIVHTCMGVKIKIAYRPKKIRKLIYYYFRQESAIMSTNNSI